MNYRGFTYAINQLDKSYQDIQITCNTCSHNKYEKLPRRLRRLSWPDSVRELCISESKRRS